MRKLRQLRREDEAAPLGACLLTLLGASALALELAFTSCRSSRDSESAAASGAVVHLLDRLADASIDATHARDVRGEFGEPRPEDRLLFARDADLHGEGADAKWIDAARALGGGDQGALRVAFVAAPADETIQVRARARARADASSDAEAAWLGYVPLLEAPPTRDAIDATLKRLQSELRATLRKAPLANGTPGSWQDLSLVARPYIGRRSLLVVMSGGAKGIDVDEIEVRRLTPAETLAVVPDESVAPAVHPLRRQVEIDLGSADSLALPAPGRVTWTLRVPPGDPRLTMVVAARLDRGAGPLRLAVAVDDVTIAARSLAADGATRAHPFEPWSVDLGRFAGRTVRLALVADGPDESVALFGAPTLLSRTKSASPADVPRNVVVISLDTLRADAVGCYRGGASDTPHLDRVARDGIRFARVATPTSWTLPAHMTLFSGQHPLVHETVKATLPMDPARTRLLASRLREAGFATGAFTAGGLVHARYGFGVGFDTYFMKDPGGIVGSHRRIGDAPDRDAPPGEDRMQPVVDWIAARRDVPFFLFVHTYLVHNYRPRARWMADGRPQPTLEELEALRSSAQDGDEAAVARMRELYRWSAREADEEIVGRIDDTLASLGLQPSTLVVVVSDHGEEFREHGALGHGNALFGESTSVPWIMRGPGVPSGMVRDERATLADVAPTIAVLLRLPDDARVLGEDRLAAAPATARDPEPVVLTLRDVARQCDRDALIAGPWKLVRRREKSGDVDALFDLSQDPAERVDLVAREPERAAQLGRLLEARIQQIERSGAALPRTAGDRRFQMSSELERMLDGLGYAQR